MENNSEINGTLILHPNVKREQFIYASQNYGSLYAIHAKFIIENNLVKSVELKLYNYKGLINIGFKSKNSTKYLENDYFEKGILKLILPVQGLRKRNTTTINFEDDIKFADIKEVIANRLLFKLKNKSVFKGQVFDNEFHYRGEAEVDYENDKTYEDSKRKIWDGMQNENAEIINRNCHTSHLMVYKIDPNQID